MMIITSAETAGLLLDALGAQLRELEAARWSRIS